MRAVKLFRFINFLGVIIQKISRKFNGTLSTNHRFKSDDFDPQSPYAAVDFLLVRLRSNPLKLDQRVAFFNFLPFFDMDFANDATFKVLYFLNLISRRDFTIGLRRDIELKKRGSNQKANHTDRKVTDKTSLTLE